jgi:hypothetical protein
MDVADIEAHILRNFDNDPDVWYKSEDAKALLAEASQLAWRTLMWSQELHEKYGGAPLAPGARVPSGAGVSSVATKPEPGTRFLKTVWTGIPGRTAEPCLVCGKRWGRHSAGESHCPNPEHPWNQEL